MLFFQLSARKGAIANKGNYSVEQLTTEKNNTTFAKRANSLYTIHSVEWQMYFY